jgi:hypothetical protein
LLMSLKKNSRQDLYWSTSKWIMHAKIWENMITENMITEILSYNNQGRINVSRGLRHIISVGPLTPIPGPQRHFKHWIQRHSILLYFENWKVARVYFEYYRPVFLGFTTAFCSESDRGST